MNNEKILFLDDDELILSSIKRQLHRKFTVATADTPVEAMRLLRTEGHFAVVVSDLKMPMMDGVQFLSRLNRELPDTVRVLLTGHGGLEAAVDAINNGQVFRFLTKPCPPEVMEETLRAAIRQYQLVTAERELLEKTLQASIRVMVEVMGLSHPVVYQRSLRVTRLMTDMARELGVSHPWEWEVAAMLSQIGCLTLQPETLDKLYLEKPLSQSEKNEYLKHPAVGAKLVRDIPRLAGVAEIIACQERTFDGQGETSPGPVGNMIPLAARALKAALDFDLLSKTSRLTPAGVLLQMREKPGRYDPPILEALQKVVGQGEVEGELLSLTVDKFTAAMVLQEDVFTRDGVMVVRKAEVLSSALLERLHLFRRTSGLKEPILVLVPKG